MSTLEAQACTVQDKQKMIDLVDLVMREGIDQSFLTDYPLVYQDSNMQNIYIIKDGEDVVSVVPVLPREVVIDDCRFEIGIISPTATSPDHRKKGYALKCVKACIEKMRSGGVDLTILWTIIPTFRFYEHAKFQAVRSQDSLYSCNKKDASLFANNGHTVVEYDPSSQQYIEDIQKMHEKEPVGVVRKDQDYPLLFSLPKSKTLIALQGDKPLGYLMISHSVNKPGLVEAGGDKAAVETLVNFVLSNFATEENLNVYANLTPTVLESLFIEKLPDSKHDITVSGMMIVINNVSNFMKHISPFLIKKNAGKIRSFSIEISDTSEVVSFVFSKDGLNLGTDKLETHLEISLQDFTSVVFGAHIERPVATPKILEGLFPFYFPIWQLDHS